MNFELLFSIYGATLPKPEVFFYDGKHSVTPKNVAKHYGVRKCHMAWDKFQKEYTQFAVKAKLAAKKVKDDSKE
ncbi:hypothetical protein [Vibrio phage VCPH]|nr:hypothetical protein [Vibrio phage VCPH]